MKSNIHPTWHDDTVVTCACGNTFKTGSTKQSIHVDICSQCHPFFTGEMRFVDIQGRVEKFQAKQQKAQTFKATQKSKKKQKEQKQEEALTLKEMLEREKKRLQQTPPAK